MKILIAVLVLVASVIPASAQQFELLSGSAQIGHVPGRINLLKPELKTLSLGEHVSFAFTLLWPQKDYNPCSEAEGCAATIGIRHRPDGFVDTWTTYTFRTDNDPVVKFFGLPSKADDNVLPCGHHDVFVRITGLGETLFQWYVPVAIHVERCPGK